MAIIRVVDVFVFLYMKRTKSWLQEDMHANKSLALKVIL